MINFTRKRPKIIGVRKKTIQFFFQNVFFEKFADTIKNLNDSQPKKFFVNHDFCNIYNAKKN